MQSDFFRHAIAQAKAPYCERVAHAKYCRIYLMLAGEFDFE
jgi:hypothetical protein